ncbi:MAG: leukotoxin LktA family filamentous adhesin [Hyphomicrobiaceae bacterium]|nr:leukotoxin LktA family filamentous adhesin [Hyphomicrobiaceae bacterium]
MKKLIAWFCIIEAFAWPFAAITNAGGRVVPDGRTATTLSVNGRTTDVHTGTVHGSNAYNSFRSLGVGAGDTVNLHVPGQADNLINLVREGRTDIDGTLNGVKNGRIGGNIYLLNPNGIVVGPSGTVNAGSLSLQTPTSDFLDSVLDPNGTPNSAAVGRILSGTAPVSRDGRISVFGQINTLDSIYLRGGGVDVSGALRAGAAGVKAMRGMVNLNGLVPAANTISRDQRGVIYIGTPGKVRVSGRIDASGEAGRKGGRIDIRADGDIELAGTAVVTAAGSELDSDGGDVVIFAGDTARLAKGALVDASGGETGRGGFVEFSATQLVSLDGGELRARSQDGRTGVVYVDPAVVAYTADTVLSAGLATVEATQTISVATGITVSTGVAGDALIFRAPNITLASGSKVTTRHATAGGGAATFGDITFETKVRSGSDLLTPLTASISLDGATLEGKNITLTAVSENTGGVFGKQDAQSTITLTGATITGENVTIAASSKAVSSPLGAFSSEGGTNQSPAVTVLDIATVAVNPLLAALPLRAAIGIAEADASVAVRSGTSITASGDVTISSVADAEITSPLFADTAIGGTGTSQQALPSLGIVYSRVDTNAVSEVEAGASITSGGAIDVTSATTGKLDATNNTIASSNVTIGITVAEGRANSVAKVAEGANLTLTDPTTTAGQNVTIAASNEAEYAAATNMISDTEGDNASFSANWLDVNETVRAELGADIANADSIAVTATTSIEELSGGAESSTGGPALHERILGVVAALDVDPSEDAADQAYGTFATRILGSVAGLQGPLKSDQTIEVPLQFAGAMSVVDADIEVSAKITAASVSTEGAKVEAPAGASDEEKAEAERQGSITVASAIELGKIANLAKGETDAKEDSSTAAALAVPVTTITLDTTALIDAGTAVAASEAVAVTADSKIAYDPTYLEIETVNDVLDKIAGDAGLQGAFLTSGAFAIAATEANGDQKTLGIAANVDVFTVNATTTARIGGLDAGSTPATATSVTAKSVDVTANTSVQSTHASGNLGDFLDFEKLYKESGKDRFPVKNPSGVTASVGAGATFQGVIYNFKTIAEIADRVTVASTETVDVAAKTESLITSLGGSAMVDSQSTAEVGALGVILVNSITSDTTARIGQGSTVTTSADAADISVAAEDRAVNWNLVGGVVKASNVGFGASVGVNSIDLDTVATIDGATRVEAGSSAARGDVVVAATSGGVSHSYALAAAVSTTDKAGSAPAPGSTSPTSAADNASSSAVPQTGSAATGGTGAADANSGSGGADTSSSAGQGGSSIATAITNGTGRFGITVAGDAAVNLISLGTEAEIAGVGTLTARDVKVDAKSTFGAYAGAGAFSAQSFQDPSKPKSGTVGIAGSYAHNAFERNRIEARITGVTNVTASRDVIVNALNQQSIISGAASGSAQAKGSSEPGFNANIAGAVTFNTFADAETIAEIANSSLTVGDDIDVTAEDTSTIHTGAGAASIQIGGSKGLGAGASASVNISEADVTARIADTEIVSVDSVTVDATAEREILSIAVAAAISTGSQGIQAGGAAAYNSVGGQVLAEIVDGEISDSGSVDVTASERSNLYTIAGDVTIGGSAGGGLAASIASLTGNAHARIDGTDITTDTLSVIATTDRTSIGVAAGIAANKQSVALKGSVVVNLAGNSDATDGREGTIAEIGGGATLSVTNDLTVGAAERTNMQSYAGAFAGGKTGIGAAVAVNKADGEVTAEITDATVLAAGSVSVRAVSGAANPTDTTSRTQFIGVAVTGTVGFQGGSLAGAAVVNKVDTRTTAQVTANARLGSAASKVGAVTVRADDRSVAGSGTLGFAAGSTALAASIAVDLLDKKTTARLAGETYATGDVVVDARSSQAAYGGLVSIAFGSFAFSAAVGVAEHTNVTLAEIAGGAIVHTTNNVHVNAEDKSDVIRFTGSQALVSVQTQASTTTARIGDEADVTALASGSGRAVRTGALSGGIGPSDDAAASGSGKTEDTTAELQSLDGSVGGQIASNVEQQNTQDADTETNSGAETVDATAILGVQSAATDTIKGVAVTANADQRMINLGLGVGVSGSGAALAASATVSIISAETTAEIGQNARINQGTGTAGSEQDVVVRAKTNGLTVDTAVGVAVGSSVGIGAGVDVALLEKSTTAKIGKGAQVTAARSIAVEADNKDKLVSVTLSLAGSGTVGVSGAVGVATVKNTAAALVEGGTSAATGARLAAGHDITLDARNRSDVYHITGSAALGGKAGAGIGVSVVGSQATTTAQLGAYTTADANDDLIVNADSDVRMKSATVALGGGGLAGIAGAVSVKSLKTTTLAEIGDNAAINQNATDPALTASQSVSVTADDTTEMLSVAGAGAGGAGVGIGAGLDIITMKGSAQARIGDSARVRATDDVTVDAQLAKALDGYTVAAGVATGVGVAGAVTVVKAGGSLSSVQRSATKDDGTGNSAGGQVATLTDGNTNVLAGANMGSGDGTSTAAAGASSAQTSGNVSADIAASGVEQTAGNDAVAEIGANAIVAAGDDVGVSARNVTEVDLLTGGLGVGASLGGVGIGAGLAFVDVNTLVTARIGAGAQISAGGNVSVTAVDGDDAVESTARAFAGAAGGILGLGAAVADFDFTTTTNAEIGAGALITVAADTDLGDADENGRLTISADERNHASVEAYGATIGGAAAVGLQIADVDKKGTVTAQVLDSASTAKATLTADAVEIASRHGGSTTGRVYGGTASLIGAVGVIDLDSTDDIDVLTSIGNNTVLTARERLAIDAVSAPKVSSKGYGGVAGGFFAVGITSVEATANISAVVRTGADVTFSSPGAVAILASAARPGTAVNVETEAVTGSGSLGVGVTAIEAKSTIVSDVRTEIGTGNTFTIGAAGDTKTGTLDIGTRSDVTAEADAKGGAGGFLAIGAVTSSNVVSAQSRTVIGAGTGGTVEGALNIVSKGSESLDSRTVGGAGGLIAGASARSTNTLTSVVSTTFADNTTLTGFVAGGMTVAARHTDGRVLANADARAGYLFGATGAYATNTATSTVLVDVGDRVQLASTGDLLIAAENQSTKAADGDSAYAASGGVAGGAATRSATQFKTKVDVLIGAADIRTIDDDSVFTTNDITIRAYSNTTGSDVARLDTGGAIAIAKSESRILAGTSGDRDRTRVDLANGAVVWSEDGDVAIGARTDAHISTEANAKTYGLAGAAEGISESRIFADNRVDVAGGARVYAEESVAIRSGADDRADNSVTTIARTRLYNRTVIPIDTDPKADAESNIASTISAGSGSRINAVRNIELTANSEGINADGFGRGQDLYQEALAAIGSFFSSLFGGGPVTIEDTYSGSHKTATSEINLTNAEVRAGFKNQQILEIAETPVMTVSPNPLDEGRTYRNYVPVTDAAGNPIQSEGITYMVRNDISLSDTIQLAIVELQAKIDAFAGDATTKFALENDLAVLKDRQIKLAAGAPSLAGVLVDFIVVDDVTARSGDVTMTAQKLNGSGTITAPGDTKIEIINHSAAFLQLNDLRIPEEQGGRIFFNGALVDSKATLDSLNAGSTTVTLASTANTTPTISVVTDYGRRPGQTLAADLIAGGEVYNPSGSVTMTTEGNLDVSGDIRSKTVSLSAGKDFTKSFTYGFFHVGGTPRGQFSGLATANETQTYAPTATLETDQSSLAGYNFNTGSSIVAAGDVYISAERVNINGLIQSGIAKQYVTLTSAHKLKVDAIEEAYAYYQANQSVNWNERIRIPGASASCVVASCFKTRRQLAVENFTTQGKTEAANAVLQIIDSSGTKTLFEIEAGGNNFVAGNAAASDVNDQVNHIERRIGAAYNVLTKEFEVDKAVADGGRVQIFGELLSTGGGQINVLDGFARIDIRNDTTIPVVLADVGSGGTVQATETGDVSAGRQGRIRLIDPRFTIADPTGRVASDGSPLQIAKVVDYVRLNGSVVAYDNATVDAAGNPSNAISAADADARSATHTPAPSSSHYGWTTGQEEQDKDEAIYRKSVGQAFGIDLGAIGDLLSADPDNIYNDPLPVRQGTPTPILVPVDRDGDGVNDGFGEVEYLTSGADDTYGFEFERKKLSSETVKTTSNWCSKSGWIFGCFERTYQTVVTTNNSNQLYYRHSVPASQKIGLGFLGYEEGTVNIMSAGDIHLAGSVSNTKGTTTITSTGGSILQRADVAITTADVLDLSATNGRIGGEGAVSAFATDLMERSGSRVNATAGQGLAITETRGTLRFDNLIAGSGDVKATSAGSILQTTATGKVQGTNVDLIATAGGITAQSGSVRIDTGASSGTFNATAAGTIAVTELVGDLRIGKVKTGGDVAITVETGNLLDANANDVRDTATEAELLANWNANALLDGTAAQESRDLSVKVSTDKAKDDYAFYWSTREAEGSYDAAYAFAYDAEERAALADQGFAEADIATLESEKTALYHALHALVGADPKSDTYSPTQVIVVRYEKDGKVVAPTTAGAIRTLAAVDINGAATGYAWSETDLKASISKSLVSARGDTTTVIEDANIEARNLTIDVKAGQIGTTIGEITITAKPTGLTDAERIALAAAERDDLTFSEDGVSPVTLKVAQREDVDLKTTGTLDIRANDHVFLGSEDSDLNIVRAQSVSKDIRIKSGGAITNADVSGGVVVKSANVILEAADGVGTAAKPLTGEITGRLTARSEGGDVHVEDRSGDLDVDFVYAGQAAGLTATAGSILDARADLDRNILAGSITLTAKTSIGAALNALDIEATGLVDATATEGSVFLRASDLALAVGTMTAATAVNLETVNGSIVGGSITAAGGSVTLTSSADIGLGAITAGGSLTALALGGAISQTDGEIASALDTIMLRALDDITLTGLVSGSAAADAVTVQSLAGAIIDGGDINLDIVANTAGAVTTLSAVDGIGSGNPLETSLAILAVANATSGDIQITESDALRLLSLTQSSAGGATIVTGGDLDVVGSAHVGTALVFDAGGSLTMDNAASGADVTLSGRTGVVLNDTVTATLDDIEVTSQAAIDARSTLDANRTVRLTSAGSTTISGPVTARTGEVVVDAGSSYTQTGDVAGSAGVTTTSGAETSVVGTITSALGRVLMQAAAALGIDGSVSGNTGVTITSGDATTINGSVTSNAGGVAVTAGPGDGSAQAGATIDIQGSVSGLGGSVTLTAGEDIGIDGAVTGRDSVAMAAARDATVLGSVGSQAADIAVTAGGSFRQVGNLTAQTVLVVSSGLDASITGQLAAAVEGIVVDAGRDVLINGSATAGTTLLLTAARDAVLSVSTVTAGDKLAVVAGRDGSVTGSLDSRGGMVVLRASGDLDLDGRVTAGDTVAIAAGDDATLFATIIARAGTLSAKAGGDLAVIGEMRTSNERVVLSSGGDTTIDGMIATRGGDLTVVGGDDVTLSPSTVLSSKGGTIGLTAHGRAKAAGDLTQRKGTGQINAADGSVVLKAGSIALENPIIAGSLQLSATSGDGAIKLGTLDLKSEISISAKAIEIDNLRHTGTDAPLEIAISAGGLKMSESVRLGGSSKVGFAFDPLATRFADIDLDTPSIEIVRGRIGERGRFASAQFETVLDNTSPSMQDTELQLYQARPGEVFYLSMRDRSFATEVDTLNFDRSLIIRQWLPAQPLAAGSDDVTSNTGVVLTETTTPLTGTIATLGAAQITAAGQPVPPVVISTPSVSGFASGACSMASQVNVGAVSQCAN